MSSKKRVQLICSECGHEFSLMSEFNKHMNQVHGMNNRPPDTNTTPRYKCSKCDREFVALSSKSRHEREHAGLKPFPCHICAFEFSRMSNLRTHLLRVHSKDLGVLYRFVNTDNLTKLEFDFGWTFFNLDQF